jgi:ligand-binding SRPBCC domain-containing protein
MKVSTIIDRPPEVVWRFYAVNHLRNHQRWDPKMGLWQLTDGPIGVGTRFRRRHTRLEMPIEGTMEIVRVRAEPFDGRGHPRCHASRPARGPLADDRGATR